MQFQLAKSTKIILLLVSCLLVLQLFTASRLSAVGKKVAALEHRHQILVAENESLEQKIASASALSTVEAKAAALGLKRKAKVIFLNDSVYVVQR